MTTRINMMPEVRNLVPRATGPHGQHQNKTDLHDRLKNWRNIIDYVEHLCHGLWCLLTANMTFWIVCPIGVVQTSSTFTFSFPTEPSSFILSNVNKFLTCLAFLPKKRNMPRKQKDRRKSTRSRAFHSFCHHFYTNKLGRASPGLSTISDNLKRPRMHLGPRISTQSGPDGKLQNMSIWMISNRQKKKENCRWSIR